MAYAHQSGKMKNSFRLFDQLFDKGCVTDVSFYEFYLIIEVIWPKAVLSMNLFGKVVENGDGVTVF